MPICHADLPSIRTNQALGLTSQGELVQLSFSLVSDGPSESVKPGPSHAVKVRHMHIPSTYNCMKM